MSSNVNAIDVAYKTEVNLENKSTEQLAAEVNVRYHQAEGLANMSAMMLADAGRRLIEIKGRIPHGQFESWCADNLEFSKSKAEKMMKLAERVDDESSIFSKTETFTDIGISRVWALLAAPEEVAAEVIETHDVTDMTVRELKEEIARIKEEKQEAERAAMMAENSNDDIRKELARVQRELSEAVSEKEFGEMQEDYERRVKALNEELNQVEDDKAGVQEKLDKAKEDLKKAKDKLKAAKKAQEEEIQKGIDAARPEIEKKAKEDALADSAATMAQDAENIRLLEEKVEKLEAEKAKLSNTGLMEFKILCDELQDIYHKINAVIDKQDDELAQKMYRALAKLTEGWGS